MKIVFHYPFIPKGVDVSVSGYPADILADMRATWKIIAQLWGIK